MGVGAAVKYHLILAPAARNGIEPVTAGDIVIAGAASIRLSADDMRDLEQALTRQAA